MKQNEYIIVQIFENNGKCKIYYGEQDKGLQFMWANKGKITAKEYKTREQMMIRMEYLKNTKTNATIHNLDMMNVA